MKDNEHNTRTLSDSLAIEESERLFYGWLQDGAPPDTWTSEDAVAALRIEHPDIHAQLPPNDWAIRRAWERVRSFYGELEDE